MKKTDFTKAVTEYFASYLPITCGVSHNTCESYRDTFRLLIDGDDTGTFVNGILGSFARSLTAPAAEGAE